MERKLKAACYLPGDETTTLDHLAPLANILDIPLVMTDSDLLKIAKKFYPRTKTLLFQKESDSLQFLSKQQDLVFISCKNWGSDLSQTLKLIYQRSPRFCYTPHGNSDKGWQKGQNDTLMNQDLTLVYGDLMLSDLKERGVLQSLKGHEICGNFRAHFFEKNKKFYKQLVDKHFKKLSHQNKTLLFAPTWVDTEKSSSFFLATHPLIKNLPSHYNLIIKLHPHTLKNELCQLSLIEAACHENKNIIILYDFPTIYPLCSFVDAYIGDLSSIGYDFLYFNKPMYFFKVTPSLQARSFYLFDCGIELELNEKIYQQIDKTIDQSHLSELRSFRYQETFNPKICYEKMKENLFEKIINDF